jgi:hypothetical protein
MYDSLSENEDHSRMKLQMQPNPHSLARTNLQEQIAVMHVERLAFWGIALFRYSSCVPKIDSPARRSPETEMDLGDPVGTRRVRKLFRTRTARATLLPHHSLCGFGPSACTVQFHSPRFLLRNSLDCDGRRLIPFFAATPSYIVCPSTGPARTSTECSGR